MRTVEIPREAWVHKLNAFTAIHEGWLVSLDVLGPEIGAQPAIDNPTRWASPLIGSITTARSRCPWCDRPPSVSLTSFMR